MTSFASLSAVMFVVVARRRMRSIAARYVLANEFRLDLGDQRFVDSDFKHDVVVKQLGGLEVNNHFEGGEGLGRSGVDDGGPRAIPATSIKACALACERRPGAFPLDDPPSGNPPQEKTPCSSRPIRFSTSRAPSSVREYAKGV